MRLAGWDKDIMAEANVETFLEQAEAYKDMINGNAWNKTLEYMIMSQVSHPLTAVRALECGEWAKSELFSSILNGRPMPAEDKTVWAQPQSDASGEKPEEEPFDFFGFLFTKLEFNLVLVVDNDHCRKFGTLLAAESRKGADLALGQEFHHVMLNQTEKTALVSGNSLLLKHVPPQDFRG